MDWRAYEDKKDYVNTPSIMAVYIAAEMCSYYNTKGGVEFYEDLAVKRAKILYEALDESKLLKNEVIPELRSTMN